MYQIRLRNCNSIAEGEIQIERSKLNIKYGINGTGKTTLAKAIKTSGDSIKLQELKSYFATDPASVSIDPCFDNILVYDEDFVNQVVFKEDEVIENSFEVFLKTPDYDAKRLKLDNHLLALHGILSDDGEIAEVKELLSVIRGKFKRTNTGISRTGTFKSMLSKSKIYNVPEELEGYRSFFENTDINIPWIDWKNRGDEFDVGEGCPYCTEKLDRENHNKRKRVFRDTYSKSDSQNLKQILELFEALKDFTNAEKYETLISYIKEDTPQDVIGVIISQLLGEIDMLITRFDKIEAFGRREIAKADISNIEEQIREMFIPGDLFNIFGGQKTKDIFDRINEKLGLLLTGLEALKKEMGDLKGLLNATIKKSESDINEFLKTAGISLKQSGSG